MRKPGARRCPTACCQTPRLRRLARRARCRHPRKTRRQAPQGLELVFRPDPTIWDGRFSNNAWLQELPKPITKLTWDNAALISPTLAEREQLQNGDVVELKFQRPLAAGAGVDHARAGGESVTLHLGYGRDRTGRVGTGTGFNAYALRTSDALWSGSGLEIRKTGETYPLSARKHHHNIEGRDIVREGTLDEFKADPHFIERWRSRGRRSDETLYNPDEFKYTGYKWGMSIDLKVCIGCNACTIACQAENNIPVVGKDQVGQGARCNGFAWTPISAAAWTLRRSVTSRCRACTAKMRRANWSARWARRCTTTRD